ncbi:MAG: TauD/TfdA family dioxygenase [Novosphingobium sp.]|nr:TauD/TfdA family dioxygenase [Novosphingobium sp.]
MAASAARNLSPFGEEVELSEVPAEGSDEAELLRELFHRDGLLFVRGLQLDHDQQIAFCRLFGPVPDSPFENFVISNVDKGGYLGKRELHWHNDVPFLPKPYLYAALHALAVDPQAVPTRFVSAYRGYERLPTRLRQRIEGMKALHVRERVYDRPTRMTDLVEGDICTVHDIVRTDPVSGRKFLFVNQAWTAQVIGLSQADGDALLEEIFSYFYVDDDIYEHKWREGDLVLWDNIAVQHSRGLAGEGRRTLQRVTVTEYGYEEQYPSDVAAISSELGNETMLEPEAAG